MSLSNNPPPSIIPPHTKAAQGQTPPSPSADVAAPSAMGDTSVKPPSPAPVMTHDMPGPGGSTVRQQQHHQRMLKAMEAQYAKLDDLNNRCETPSRPLQYMMERMKEHIDSLKQNGEASGIRPEQGQLKEKFKGPSL